MSREGEIGRRSNWGEWYKSYPEWYVLLYFCNVGMLSGRISGLKLETKPFELPNECAYEVSHMRRTCFSVSGNVEVY